MILICEHCGKPIERYKAIAFNIDYLENYLADYFDKPKDVLCSKLPGVKTTQEIRIMMYMVNRYADISKEDMAERYRQTYNSILDKIRNVNTDHHDFIFLDKELSGQLDFDKHKKTGNG